MTHLAVFVCVLLVLGNERVAASSYTIDGYTNCAVVPTSLDDIQQIAVIITGLDPSVTYKITPVGGAIMYWPGNSAQNYLHYAWALAITPENCAMGTPQLSPLCGSESDLTCCEYSTAKLGSPPPFLHAANATDAFQQVSTTEIFISGQYNIWAWFQDDNCSNNQGSVEFSITPINE
jgi:hypothetical protein